MISKYLNLDAKQQEKLLNWMEKLPKYTMEEAEETCNMAGRIFKFCVYSTGTGDCVYMETTSYNPKTEEITRHMCHLGYDDDGIIIGVEHDS